MLTAWVVRYLAPPTRSSPGIAAPTSARVTPQLEAGRFPAESAPAGTVCHRAPSRAADGGVSRRIRGAYPVIGRAHGVAPPRRAPRSSRERARAREGSRPFVSWPLLASNHEVNELEFHISPATRSSRPQVQAGKAADQVQHPLGQVSVGAEALGTVHCLRDVRDDPVLPAVHLIAEQSGAAQPGETHRTFAHDAAVRCSGAPRRGHLDHGAGSVKVDRQGGVIEVASLTAFGPCHDRLVGTTHSTAPAARRRPPPAAASTGRRSADGAAAAFVGRAEPPGGAIRRITRRPGRRRSRRPVGPGPCRTGPL